jgi:hypothetical protein
MIAVRTVLAIALCAGMASAQAGTGGHAGKGGSSGKGISSTTPPLGAAIAIGDPPLAGAPTGCSTKYLGLYEYGLYSGCVNTPTGSQATALTTATSLITPLNTSGTTSGCPTSCAVVFVGTGMSVALAEFNSYASAANSSGLMKTTVFNSNQAVSNNDLPLWTVQTPGTPPAPCLTTGNGQQCGSNGPAKNCSLVVGGGTGTTCNEYDVIATRLPTSSHNPLQVQVQWVDQSNGQGHQYLNGCCPSGNSGPCDTLGTSILYQICLALDGTHTVTCTDGSTYTSRTQACIDLLNTYDATNTLYELGEAMRASKAAWTNLQITFFASRVYAGYCTLGGGACADPEPKAYEKAFAIKALIHAQRCEMGDDGCTKGTIDPVAGDLCPSTADFPAGCGAGTVSGSASMLSWADVEAAASDDSTIHSGYQWANDDNPTYNSGNGRFSDGLAWCNGQSGYCAGELDFASPDFLHLTTAGAAKAGNLLLFFCEHSPYTKPWWRI